VLDPLLLVSFFVLLMMKILLQRYTPIRFAFIIIIGAILGYSCLISVNYFVLISFMFIIAMQDIDIEKILKFCFAVNALNISVHVIVYIFTYLTNPAVIRFVRRRGDGAPRHYFFMGHANMFTAFLLWACLNFIFLNYKKLKTFHMAFIWLINIIFYAFTDTNTGIIVLAAVTVLILADKKGRGLFDRPIKFLAKYTYAFCAVFFPFMATVYLHLGGALKELWHNFDNFLTGRIWFGVYAYYQHGPTFLGRPDMAPEKIFWNGRWFNTSTVFDNYYIGNFVSYGIINSIITALVLIIFCEKMENREKIMITAFAFYGVMESHVTNVAICFALFIIGRYIYPQKKEPHGIPERLWNKL